MIINLIYKITRSSKTISIYFIKFFSVWFNAIQMFNIPTTSFPSFSNPLNRKRKILVNSIQFNEINCFYDEIILAVRIIIFITHKACSVDFSIRFISQNFIQTQTFGKLIFDRFKLLFPFFFFTNCFQA